jgi:hypothetical protein
MMRVMAAYDFPDQVIARGALFEPTGPAHWPSPSIANRVYVSGAVRLTMMFSDWKGAPSEWVTWSAEVGRANGRLGVVGHSAKSPEAALEAADAQAAMELADIDSRIAEMKAWRERIAKAQEALLHPSDYACDQCRAEVTDAEATGVICRKCFDAGPSKCVECGALSYGLVCSPRCADSADLCWDDTQRAGAEIVLREMGVSEAG